MITVIDSPCGFGKTQYMINMINENPTKNYVYITPYLNEVERIKNNTKFLQDKITRFVEPVYTKKKKKYDCLVDYIYDSKDIVSTHALFSRCTREIVDIIKQNKYTLILDEVMSVVKVLDISYRDIKVILDKGIAEIDSRHELIWKVQDYSITDRYGDIYDLCTNNHVFVYNNKALIWTFPIEIFSAFKDVYICTYMFDAQIQKYYYDLYSVKYTKMSIVNNELVDYIEQKSNTDKIHIVYDDKLNSIGWDDYSLSKSWYRTNTDKLKFVKNKIYNFVRHIAPIISKDKVSSKDILWTTYKDYKSALSGKGYSKAFLPCNMRATNNYINTYVVAYMINVFLNPIILQFFKSRDVTINQDKYALSEMVQFIYRSAIRNGVDVYVYVPSKRMRNLLEKYIGKHIRYDMPF